MSGSSIERTSRRSALQAAGALAMALVGCAPAFAAQAAPRIRVLNLRSLGASGAGQKFEIDLYIDNNDVDPIAIKEIRFTLRLAGEGQIQGKSQPVTVPALTQQTIQVQVESDIISSLSRLQGLVQGADNALPYEMFGNVIVDRRFENQLPFTASGRVPLSTSTQR
ncbi:MAG TPA: LEA type 2 family protein [Gammaproteobacteria bacterium]|nr:LEA type 2 family protein [Gammaproteobacteria bacterium]